MVDESMMEFLPGVVIVIYNEEKTLESSLKKLVALFSEIVVVDNCSTDRSREICEKFPIKLIALEKSLKRGECWNEGAKHIQSETILFLHVDTQISPASVCHLQKVWSKKIYTYTCFKIRFLETEGKFRFIECISNFRSRFLKIIYGDQGLCVSKKVFNKVGKFPETYLLEDLKISRKLRKESLGFISSPIYPSPRKFHKLGFRNYLFLMYKVLFFNAIGMDSRTLYNMYYDKKR